MLKFQEKIGLTVALFLTMTSQILAGPELGKPAPSFQLQGQDGKTYSLETFKGKHIVLEWFNKDCPYVRKHYDAGKMQELQQKYTLQGVVWLGVISSAPGKQGFLSADEAKKVVAQEKAQFTALLFDPNGEVGKSYEAKTTPHMYIINPKGELIYMGAIDDQPSAQAKSLENAKNYVDQALTAALSGKPIAVANTKPYGCSVKYK